MKHIWTILIICMSMLSLTRASYTPTDEDVSRTQEFISQIRTIIQGDKPVQYSFVRQLDALLTEYPDDTQRIHYLLQNLHNHFAGDLAQQKANATTEATASYETFLRRHADQLADSTPLPAGCYTYIDDLDMIAFVHDTSLPVLIATWYREFTCGYSLPSNGRGPMQIITENYGSGPYKNHEEFIKLMEDYAEFVEEKHTRYNNVTDSGQPITMDYTDISYTDIVKHGALYNGLAGGTIYGDIAPAAPGYVFDKFGTDYANAQREGIMSASTKVMQRWIENR